jgi:hypothetical protein
MHSILFSSSQYLWSVEGLSIPLNHFAGQFPMALETREDILQYPDDGLLLRKKADYSSTESTSVRHLGGNVRCV